MKLNKTKSFEHENKKQNISLQVKILLCSEIALHSKNFAILAKFLYNIEIAQLLLLASCMFQLASNLFQLQFLRSCLDAIEDKSYELGVNQLDFDMPVGLRAEYPIRLEHKCSGF